MGEHATTPYRGYAFNPDGLWGFRTALSRVRRRIIRVSWRRGLALSAKQVAAWNDVTDAGFTFSLAETTLNPEDENSFAVVVGELIPMAARIGATFPTYYKSPKVSDKGLRKRLKWITLEEERPRCLVVRRICSPDNNLHVLADKSTLDGLCALRAAPGQKKCQHYIAFYDEWAGSGEESTPGVMRTSIKRKLDAFCQQSLQKFRSSITKPPVLSEGSVTSDSSKSVTSNSPKSVTSDSPKSVTSDSPKSVTSDSSGSITSDSRETQDHANISHLQQTVTNLAEKQSQADERPSTIVTQTTREASPEPLEPQEQSKDASNSIPISSPLQTALEPAEPGQQPESEANSDTQHTELATAELQNLARMEQNSEGCQILQDSHMQNSKGCQTLQESPVHNCKGCQTLRKLPVQNSKGCQTLQESPVQSGPSEMTKMNTCLARLFTIDDEYTYSNALELLSEMKETTQQFARSASLRTNPVLNALSVSQTESQKYGELAQINALALAKACIERTITFANLAVENLDALLPGHGSTNDVASGLNYALGELQDQLLAITDAFSIEMRNNILSLARCAQADGAMRIREVREVVMAIKVALETLLQNLDVVG